MSDYREELLNKILIGINGAGVDINDQIREAVVRSIGDYEIAERCTDLAVRDDSNYKLMKLFFATKKTEGGSDETAKTRYSIYRRLSDDVGKPFGEMNAFDIRLWLANEQRRVSLSTADSYRSALGSFFTWLHEEGLIASNPMSHIKPIKHPDAIKKSFTSVEVDALKSACKSKLERAIVEILLSSGLRCEELCNLKWADVNFSSKDITVIEGKGNKNRITMMDDVARKYLLAYKNSIKEESEYVFPTRYRCETRRRDESSVWLMLKKIGKRAGIEEANPHKYRHTFATMLYKRGMDIHMIQRLLGHSSINTTLIYIDSDMDSLRNAYKRCE